LQQLQHECLGVGCSSTLIRAHSGKLEVEGTLTTRALKSHAHISTWSADGSIYQYDITLCNQLKDEQIAESMTTSRRNRLEEEQVIGALILWAILRHRNCITYHSQAAPHKRIMEEDKVLQRILDRPGDTIAIRQFEQYFPHQKLLGDQEYWSSFSTTKYVTANIVPWQDKVEYIVNRILCKEVDTSILIPQRVTPSMIATNDMLSDTVLIEQRNHSTQFSIMGHTMLPHNVIIMPGSFNPLHQGHVSLANAAINALQINMEQSALRTDYSQSDLQNKDTVLDKVWNATIQRNQDMKWSILFEISLFNADKPPIESKEVIRRLETFTTYLRENETAAQLSSLDWGVLLSSSPLFLEKVEMLKKYLVGKPLSFMGQMPIRLVFVIGADTMVRIINPKYYQNSTGKMIDAVRRMREAGVNFIVGARLDQSVVVSNTDAPRKHVTGEDELECLPEDVRSLFTLLPGFRVDISSSEIRARKL
jgi:nicotinic acid mononucleotide adenylyltransferase